MLTLAKATFRVKFVCRQPCPQEREAHTRTPCFWHDTEVSVMHSPNMCCSKYRTCLLIEYVTCACGPLCVHSLNFLVLIRGSLRVPSSVDCSSHLFELEEHRKKSACCLVCVTIDTLVLCRLLPHRVSFQQCMKTRSAVP